jgi:hypothetical protein
MDAGTHVMTVALAARWPAQEKSEKKTTATTNTAPATIPTHAKALFKPLRIPSPAAFCSAAPAAEVAAFDSDGSVMGCTTFLTTLRQVAGIFGLIVGSVRTGQQPM